MLRLLTKYVLFLDYKNSSSCYEASQGFNVALISPDGCFPINYDSLSPSMLIDTKFLDEEELHCHRCAGINYNLVPPFNSKSNYLFFNSRLSVGNKVEL
jgi:hypothetical protein